MEENYEEIVTRYYLRLMEPFLRKLTRKYPSMRLDKAKDIYQDAFIAVQENIQNGRVRENTDWDAYIQTIGFNLASKDYRHEGITESFGSLVEKKDKYDGVNTLGLRVEDILKEMPVEDIAFCKDPVVISTLGDELAHTPDPCAKIIRLFYYCGAKLEEIAEETGYKNATTVKTKKNRCMSDLAHRVTNALRLAGFDVTPKKSNRDGKN